MPLDPSIYDIIKPAILPLVSPQQREAQQALTEQRQALADERRERLQKLRDEALDVAAINQSMASAFPNGAFDPDEFLANVQRSGRFKAAELASKFVDDQNKARAELATKHADAQSKQLENTLKIIRAANPDGSDWPQWRQAAIGSAGDPEGQKLLSQMLPEQFDADALARLQETGGTSKDYFDRKAQAAKDAPKSAEEWMTATGRVLSTPGVTAQQWDDWTKHMASFGGEGKVVAAMAGPLSPENQAKVKTWAISPEKQADLAEKAADNLRMAASETRLESSAAETARHNKEMERLGLIRANRPPAAQGGGAAAESDAKEIAHAIMRGEQPPETTGMYGKTAAIKAELARNHYDLTHALEDWNATKRYLNTLNGAQQTRLRQAVEFTSHSLDVVDDLNNQWKGGRFPLLNKAQLIAAKNGALGKDAQRIATQLDAQIGDLISELGTVYKGGNSSTDESLKLAAQNLSANWSQSQLAAAIDLTRKNLTIRANSIKNVGPIGGTPQNPYAPQQSAPTATEKTVTTAELQAIAKKRGTTVEQEKARATAAGYIVR